MSHSSHLPADLVTLKQIGEHDRLYEIVSFTENFDDHISLETIFFLSVLLGNKDWVDTLFLFGKEFPKHESGRVFQLVVHGEIKLALLDHFKNVFEKHYPGRRTITKQEKRTRQFRSQMQWRKWRSGYHGVIIKPDYVGTIEKTREFVRFIVERWRANSVKTKREKDYVWDNFEPDNCLDWILDPTHLENRLREIEEKYGTL